MNFESYLPAGIGPETVIVAMAGLSACVTILSIWFALLHRDPGARRALVLARRREDLRAGLLAARPRRKPAKPINLARRVVERLRLIKSEQAAKVSLALARAGLRSRDALVVYLFVKVALPFLFGGVGVFLLYGLDVYALAPMAKLGTAAGLVLLGAYAPDLYVRNATIKRQDRLRKALPDGLDLMIICAESGLTLDATLARVSTELARAQPELADEFGLTGVELGLLPDRRQALLNLAQRTGLPGVRAVVNTLIQAERYGTPLAQSLRVMSAESRRERILKAEEKAARLPALLTVPMIVFILPPLFVVLLGPAVLDIADAFLGLGL